jgi:hypothetical protein
LEDIRKYNCSTDICGDSDVDLCCREVNEVAEPTPAPPGIDKASGGDGDEDETMAGAPRMHSISLISTTLLVMIALQFQ